MPSAAEVSGDFFLPIICQNCVPAVCFSTRGIVRPTNLARRALVLARSEPGPSSRKPWCQAKSTPACCALTGSPRSWCAAACMTLVASESASGCACNSAVGSVAGVAPVCTWCAACRKARAACAWAGLGGFCITRVRASKPWRLHESSCAVRHAALATPASLMPCGRGGAARLRDEPWAPSEPYCTDRLERRLRLASEPRADASRSANRCGSPSSDTLERCDDEADADSLNRRAVPSDALPAECVEPSWREDDGAAKAAASKRTACATCCSTRSASAALPWLVAASAWAVSMGPT